MLQSGDSREAELQNILTDERNRCNQYKQIYQTLKEKHNKLQDELTLIYEKLKEAVSHKERLISSNELTVKKLEARIKEQQTEIDTYLTKLKAHDEKKIRASVLEEASSHYEAKINELHSETDRIREQYNTLHYENVVLKCNFESREAEYSRSLEGINRQHQAEIELLKSKIEELQKEKDAPTDSYAVELKSSKREVLQLTSKNKVLLSECEELRAQNEHLTLQISSLNRTNAKQISDHATNIRLLESEKQKITMQKEVLEKELTNAQEHRKALNNELQASKREIISLRSKLEECEHKCRVTITNLQVELEQKKSNSESEHELLVEEIARLKSDLQEVHNALSQERESMAVSERSFQQNLSIVRQQLWKQSREITEEKDSFERKVRDIAAEKDKTIAQLKQEISSLKQNLHICSASKAELQREFVSLRDQLNSASQNDSQKKGQALKQNLNYEQEIQELREKIDLLSAGGFQIVGGSGATSNAKSPDHEIIQLKLSWEQQKLQYQQRLDEVESQFRELRNTSSCEKRELEFKLKQYAKQINKLRDRLELQKTENEELEMQKSALEKNVPYEVHSQVKNHLTELQKRLNQYGMLIAAEPGVTAKNIPGVAFSEKLLSDIKNTQFQALSPQLPSDDVSKSDVFQASQGSTRVKTVENKFPKKTLRRRKKSLKTQDKRYQSRTGSPIISSSSDLDLENLG